MTQDNTLEKMIHTRDMAWINFAPGIDFKVLRTSSETGTWTVLFKCAQGAAFPAHFHHGAGEYLMISGAISYRMDTALAGDYGYEPLGAYHELTTFDEDSELLFTNHGPVAFVGEDNQITMLLDWKYFADKAMSLPQ